MVTGSPYNLSSDPSNLPILQQEQRQLEAATLPKQGFFMNYIKEGTAKKCLLYQRHTSYSELSLGPMLTLHYIVGNGVTYYRVFLVDLSL